MYKEQWKLYHRSPKATELNNTMQLLIVLSFCMSSTLLHVPLVLVALLEHSELAVYSFRNLISVLQQYVPCHVKVFKIMREYHVQLQSLTHFKLFMELQEISPHFGNYSFTCVEVQGVAVHKSVQKIDVPKVLNKEKVIFRNISAQYLK